MIHEFSCLTKFSTLSTQIFKRYCHKCGNTDNPNAQTKQSEQSVKKEHNLINMKKMTNHDEEADIVVEVEHPVETTDDE